LKGDAMLWKAIKLATITVGSAALVGGFIYETEAGSYVRSTYNSMFRAAKADVPVDFQIQRARDLLADTGPEMQKNVRLMAEEEVDIADLRTDIGRTKQSLGDEKTRLQKLRDDLATSQVSFTFGDFTYTRQELAQELSRRLQNYQQGISAESQKEQLLIDRQKALGAAVQAMDIARAQRTTLESEIEGLEGRYRLVQATAAGSGEEIDNSKLAQATQAIGEIRRQLDISDRMLAQEARFSQPMPIDTVNEKDLLSQVDAQLSGHPSQPASLSMDVPDASTPSAVK
jgi:hypothetical protein